MDHYPHLRDLYLSARLRAELQKIPSHLVTTIIAPTGYGKTTAAGWFQQQLPTTAPKAHIFRQFLSGNGRQEFWDGLCRTLRSAPAEVVRLS